MFSDNEFEIQVKTFYGLENLLAEELKSLGGRDIQVKNRAVVCFGDLGFLYKINYSLRTGMKVLVPIFNFKAFNEHKFYQKLKAFPWEDYFSADQSFSIDATVHSEKFTHSRFMSLKMKDAIVDHFRESTGRRPSVDTDDADIRLHLHIQDDLVTVALDSSGQPLYKRGYRAASGTAPLNEVLAAGMLMLAGWDGKGNFLDPMAGSGTLLIEAAMIAQNLPAQLYRKNFGFQNWKNYDAELFAKIKETRLNRIREFNGKIVGYELDERMIATAEKNIQNAELEDIVSIEKQDFFTSEKNLFPLLIVFNPPYDERISINQDDFYQKIGDTFKQHYPNTLAWLITADLSGAKHIGLRPSRRIKLFNGKLETRFLQFEMYEGTKKTHKLNFNS